MSPAQRPRRSPQQDRSRALVDAILDATAEVLRAHGLAGATVHRIAARAGVSVGSLYQYFPNKAALYGALAERFFARMEEATEAAWPLVRDAPPRQAVATLVRGVLALAFVDPILDRILHEVAIARLGPGPVVAFEARQEARMLELLTRRRAELPDPDLDLELAARILTRAVGGVVSSTFARDPAAANDPRFYDALVRLVEGYLGFRAT